LGFVLIYKATELVNFAQGDLMMLGAFVCYMLVVWYGWGYWAAFAAAVAAVALFGAGLDAGILRRVLGQPQFAVVMLTIGLGAIFRSFASITWGSEIYTLPTPFSAKATRIATNLGFIGRKAFAAAVLGGFGSIPGALVGGLTIGLIELWSGAYLPQGFKDVAAYVVLLLVLAVRPQGMFGTVGRKKV